MKRVELAIATVIPVALAVGGYFALRNPGSSKTWPSRPEGTSTTVVIHTPKPAIPRSRWQKVPAPTGSRVRLLPSTRKPGKDTAEVLTLALLKSLIAENTAAAWTKIESLLRTGQLDDPAGIEALLVKTLGRGGNYSAYVMKLLPLLKDPDLRLRAAEDLMTLAGSTRDSQTLRALFQVVGELGNGSMVSQLGQFADSLTDRAAVAQAILAIGRIGSRESATELARLLTERPDRSRLSVIQDAIATVKTPEMVKALTPLLAADQPDELRAAAAGAMGRTGRPEAVAPLQALIEGGASRAVKEASLGGLGHIMTRDAVEELLRVRKGGGPLWFDAGLALGNGHAEGEAASFLLKELDAEPDERIRVSMIRALEGSQAPGVQDKFVSYLGEKSQPASVRSYAARALGQSESPKVVAPLVETLQNSDPADQELRRSILNSFVKLSQTRSMSDELRKKALPVVKKMAASAQNRQDVFWLQRTLRILKQL